jgi:uncharacterized protein (DUF1800 family)
VKVEQTGQACVSAGKAYLGRWWGALLASALLLSLAACGGSDQDGDAKALAASAAATAPSAAGTGSRKAITAMVIEGPLTDTQALLYIASYSDLIAAFGADPAAGRAHYAANAKAERRVISFEAERYIASYPDLIESIGADPAAGARHFILTGWAQGRRPSFDALRYLASYSDLAQAFGADEVAGARHYIIDGYREKRVVTFDALRYTASYSDLIAAFGTDTEAATRHYLIDGWREGRHLSFDPARYLGNYEDLRQAFGDDLAAASQHFIVYGMSEGRTDATFLTVRARGSLSNGVGPTMIVRVNDVVVGSVVVQSTLPTDYVFRPASLSAGAKVEVVFNNDANVNGDRNLYIQYLNDRLTTVLPTLPGAVVDRGSNQRAFDGLDLLPGQGELTSNGALRLSWPAAAATETNLARKFAASRLLLQASFGPTSSELDRLVGMTDAAWVNEQIALPVTNDFVPEVQRLYDLSATNRPGGSTYDSTTPVRRFWATAAGSPDQLRKRVAFALHQIFMVSQADSNLYDHTRAYANYLDTLNRQAFGNYRNLLEDIALSPVMGIYLSHIRNRKENPTTGLLPDENFAREVMQLFTIGLHELNIDGTPRLDGNGKPVETYNNADVMAMAKVFTGWSWGFPDAQLTDSNFRYGSPKYTVAADTQIDLQRMKAYPGQHSTSEKPLFAGKASAVTIPANTSAGESLRIALDTLFNHPNVGPFIGRQLIQRLTTSNPSPAYVARVATAFNNNGQGVRGDMAAVVRAILLDAEARQTPAAGFGKLKEPILRVANWMRAFGATSATGNFMMVYELDSLNQRPYNAPSVFSYFRPGYIPPNSALAEAGATAPEFQIVNESTAPSWVNLAENMAGGGIGWTGSARDIVPAMNDLAALSTAGNVDGLLRQIDLRLFGGRMPAALRQDLLDAVTGVSGTDAASHLNRARVAVFVALSSPEFLVQR